MINSKVKNPQVDSLADQLWSAQYRAKEDGIAKAKQKAASATEKASRPVSRQRNVTGEPTKVQKRGEGLGSNRPAGDVFRPGGRFGTATPDDVPYGARGRKVEKTKRRF